MTPSCDKHELRNLAVILLLCLKSVKELCEIIKILYAGGFLTSNRRTAKIRDSERQNHECYFFVY